MRPDLPPLFVLRHGETTWNVEGRLQGRLDSPLTALGQRQAAAQNAILSACLPAGTTARVSTAPRARLTAEIALNGLDVPLVEDERLVEIGLGDWQGRTVDEIERTVPHVADDQDPHLWKFSAPDGERLEDMAARCRNVLADLDRPTVLVTHGITSRILRALALGLPVTDLSDLPGGQGVVHVIEAGQARILTGPGQEAPNGLAQTGI